MACKQGPRRLSNVLIGRAGRPGGRRLRLLVESSLQENASLPTACPGRQRHKPSRQRLCRPQSHVAVGKEQSAKPGSAKADLPTATWHTVGKAFANCHASSRHSHVAPSALTAGFADCWFLGSRQRIIFSKIVCRLAASSAVGKERKYFFLKCSLPTAFGVAVGKDLTPLQSAKTLSWGFFAQAGIFFQAEDGIRDTLL